MTSSILVSIFEGGYQPVNALSGLGALREAGHNTDFLDAYVDGYDIDQMKGYDLIILPIPLFDSLNSAIQLCNELDASGSKAEKVMFGQYATINAPYLSGRYADHVLVEWEVPLVSLLNRKTGSANPTINIYAMAQSLLKKYLQ